jgi:uncharacterized membrane protein YdjX (TVP38/TMEM64 family)
VPVDDPNHQPKINPPHSWSNATEPGPTRFVYLGLLVLLVVGIGFWLWRPTAGLEDVLDVLELAGPVPFFTALVALPLIGMPTTPFYLLAGPAFGPTVALVGTAMALAIQQVLGYWLARRWLHGVLERLLACTGFQLPEVKAENHVRFTVLVRLAPGVPSWAKNYVGGLARTPFLTYFWISWPISLAYAAGFILLGDAAFSRDWREVIPAVFLVAVLILLRRFLRSRTRRSQ